MTAAIDESAILAACEKKREYILSNLENVTMKVLRKEIEADMGLEKDALKEHKSVITAFVDKLLAASRAEEASKTKTARSPAAKKAPATKKAPAKGKAVGKGKKDPNKPKKALTAFMFFSNEKRAQVKQEYPEIAKSVTDMSRKLGELWKAATDEDKAPYNKMAEEDKLRYAKEMESYMPPDDTEPAPKKAKAAAKKAPRKASGGSTGGAASKYSAKVERLKKICKQASINIPTHLFKKFKDSGDVVELENDILGLLEKQGLSAKSSKDEIEMVREKLQLARDMEGIDTSNIIKSPEGGGRRSRRQAAVAAENFFSQEPLFEESDEDAEDGEDEDGGDDDDDSNAGNGRAEKANVDADDDGGADEKGDDEGSDSGDEDDESETPETSMASLTDSDFEVQSDDEDGTSPTPRKRGRKTIEDDEGDEDGEDKEEAVDEVTDRDLDNWVDQKLHSIEKKAKPADMASQAVPKKLADWSDDDDDA